VSRACCCAGDTGGRGGPRLLARRAFALTKWAVPGVTLALIPKCPLCFAAYIAIWTGIGLSCTAASYIRVALIILCIASLTYLAASFVRRRFLVHLHP